MDLDFFKNQDYDYLLFVYFFDKPGIERISIPIFWNDKEGNQEHGSEDPDMGHIPNRLSQAMSKTNDDQYRSQAIQCPVTFVPKDQQEATDQLTYEV